VQQSRFISYLDDLHGKHLALPSWEQKLKTAQKSLFNHELFSQVSMTILLKVVDVIYLYAVIT